MTGALFPHEIAMKFILRLPNLVAMKFILRLPNLVINLIPDPMVETVDPSSEVIVE